MPFTMQDFYNSLKSVVSQNEILTRLDYDLGITENIVIPMFENATDTDFDSQTSNTVFSKYKGLTERKHVASMYDAFMDSLRNLVDYRKVIEDVVKKEFNKENPKSITDYYKLNILKYIEGIQYLNDYATSWITVATVESVDEHKTLTLPDIKIRKGFVLDHNNILTITSILDITALPFHEFLDKIKALKGQVFTEYDWNTRPDETERKTNVIKSGLISPEYNPFYHLNIMWVGWQVEKENKLRHEHERLQFLLLQLKEKRSVTRNEDAIKSLEKQIEYRSDQINKMEIRLRKIEERYTND